MTVFIIAFILTIVFTYISGYQRGARDANRT